MLTVLREGAKSGFTKFVLFSFLIMAVGGLVMMDVGGFFRGGVSQGYVAKVAGTKLPTTTFDRSVQRVLSRQGLSPQMAYQVGFIDQILEAEISGKLMQRASHDIGLNISDQIVLGKVQELVAPYVSSDVTHKDAVQRILMSQGMSEAEFIGSIRSEMANTIIRTALQNGTAFASNTEIRDMYQYQNEERVVEMVVLRNSKVTDLPEATDEVLMPLYQAGKERFSLPEVRSFTLAVLSMDEMAKTLEISEEEIRADYDDNIDLYTLPERRKMRQTIVAEQAIADKIAAAVKDGTSMSKAVEEVTGSKDAYLGEQTFEKDGLMEEISEEAFAAEKGAVIGPIQSALGWHVFHLREILQPDVKPFSQAKQAIKRELEETRLADSMISLANEIDDRLAGGASIEEVADAMGLKTSNYGPVRADGSTVDNKEGFKEYENDRDFILQTAFEMMELETSPVFEIGDGSYAALRVDSVQAKTYKPFEDVKNDIKELWKSDQQASLNKAKTQEEFKALLGGERSMKDIAADNGSVIKRITLKRAEPAAEPLTQPSKTKFFETELDDVTIATVQDGFAIGKVVEINLPEYDKAKKEAADRTKQMLQRGNADEFTLIYLDELREKYGVTVNKHVLETIYGPGSEQF